MRKFSKNFNVRRTIKNFEIWTNIENGLSNQSKSLFNIVIFCPAMIKEFIYYDFMAKDPILKRKIRQFRGFKLAKTIVNEKASEEGDEVENARYGVYSISIPENYREICHSFYGELIDFTSSIKKKEILRKQKITKMSLLSEKDPRNRRINPNFMKNRS